MAGNGGESVEERPIPILPGALLENPSFGVTVRVVRKCGFSTYAAEYNALRDHLHDLPVTNPRDSVTLNKRGFDPKNGRRTR